MEAKQIYTKTQAVSILQQIPHSQEINIFAPVDKNNSNFKLSCEDLEKKLLKYSYFQQKLSAVVDDPVAL